MTRRALLAGWITLAAVTAVLLVWELVQWRALAGDGLRAGGERQRLTNEIALRDAQIAAELRGQAPALREMRWAAGTDPGSFLTRLADLARDEGVRVSAVGPLERQVTPQWTRTWHTVQVVAPFRDVRALAARIEAARGLLDDVRLEVAPAAPAARPGAPAPADLVQARFRLSTLELTAPARRIVERALAAGPAPSPELPAAAGPARDPFAFALPKPPAPPPPAAPRAEPSRAPLDLTAIVGFSGSFLAIVNNQVVKVGDVVSGHEVVAISESAVTMREPGAPPRTLQLPELGAAPPGPPPPPTRR